MTEIDYSNPLEPNENFRNNMSPIFGSQASVFIQNGASFHITGRGDDVTEYITHKGGIAFYMDIQPEGEEEYIISGTKSLTGACIILYYNADKIKNRIKLEIRDDFGKALIGSAQLNHLAAKFLYIDANFSNKEIKVKEINLCTLPIERNVEYSSQEQVSDFANLKYNFNIGTCNFEGSVLGSYKGKIASFYFYSKSLLDENVNDIVDTFRLEIANFYGVTKYVPISTELAYLFLDDYIKLKNMVVKPFTISETREASGILFRWLLDKPYRMLVDLAQQLGIQLTFPGYTDKEKSFAALLASNAPTFGMTGTLGKRSFFGHKWLLIDDFIQTTVFYTEGFPVSISALIKLIRTKLGGGGHFDYKDRKSWQERLIYDYYKMDNHVINHQTREIVIAVLEALDECRVIQHIPKPSPPISLIFDEV